jgi:hypothetical protein
MRIQERGAKKENETILLITPGLAERIILSNQRTTHTLLPLFFGLLRLVFSPLQEHPLLGMLFPSFL